MGGFLEKRTIIKRKTRREREKRLVRNCHLLLSPPPLTLFAQEPSSNAICTANGGQFARARRRTKTLPDPRSMGALRGAILGKMLPRHLKWLGLAYEVSCIMVVLLGTSGVVMVGRRWGSV